MADDPNASQLFDELVRELLDHDGVEPPSGGRSFGRSALKVDNKIFAMLVNDCLVVRLPAERIAAVLQSGAGQPFDANKGRPMKEWLQLEVADRSVWTGLAGEALAFVSR